MKKVIYTTVVLALLVPTVAFASFTNRWPTEWWGHSSTYNHPEFWEAHFGNGVTCEKIERGFSGSTYNLPTDAYALIIKASIFNFVWFYGSTNPVPAGSYGTPTYQNVSHVIVCYGEPQYETCSEQTDWVFFNTSEEQKPNGTIVIKHTYFKYDLRDQETICDTMVAVERIPYKQCTEVVVGEWTPWSGDGKDKTSYREYRDAFSGELCNTEYREKCESQNFVHFWTDGFCKFRDLTYPLNASWMVNPPVFAQNAYCGCGYEPHGPWGIVEVGECDEDGYKYWTELPPYCGYQSCE